MIHKLLILHIHIYNNKWLKKKSSFTDHNQNHIDIIYPLKISQCSFVWPRTHYVDQTGLELKEIHLSLLGLKYVIPHPVPHFKLRDKLLIYRNPLKTEFSLLNVTILTRKNIYFPVTTLFVLDFLDVGSPYVTQTNSKFLDSYDPISASKLS